MRGGTVEALEKAEQYRTLVQQRLTEIRGSLPVLEAPPDPALGVRPMSEEEIKLNNQWPQVTFSSWTHDWIECYTDGSFIPNSQSAGWGVALCEKGRCFPFWGAVQLDPSAPDFCGASRASNNTGELSAILFACKELYERDSRSSGHDRSLPSQSLAPVLILYDSTYAA